MDKIQKLELEIERLEEKMEKNHFGGLFNKDERKRDENKLRKLKRELEQLQKTKKN
nr:hypothetical protein [candidate division Zixibacteria bacterium]